jgi:hypothetical protein
LSRASRRNAAAIQGRVHLSTSRIVGRCSSAPLIGQIVWNSSFLTKIFPNLYGGDVKPQRQDLAPRKGRALLRALRPSPIRATMVCTILWKTILIMSSIRSGYCCIVVPDNPNRLRTGLTPICGIVGMQRPAAGVDFLWLARMASKRRGLLMKILLTASLLKIRKGKKTWL